MINKIFSEIKKYKKLDWGGEYILFIDCFYRFLLNGKLYLSMSDSVEYDSFRLLVRALPYGGLCDYEYDYEYDMQTNIDNKINELKLKNCIVNEVCLMKTDDLKINFTNGFSLEIFVDTTQARCWEYFKAKS